ncbi:MAG: ferrous iron transport protein B [Thermoguttaceae bacterium]|jgi:ferrous iron transport protein B
MVAQDTSTSRVALIGNPNTGKSTLFGALVGVHQHVANYPGVTVEKKTGWMTCGGRRCEVIDLPGLYSLAARSRDEMVAVDVLLGRQDGVGPPDAVVAIVDACNLQRNFYLLSQVLEMGLPMVLAVNMSDLAAGRGIVLDLKGLAERLGVGVVALQANRGVGVPEVKTALDEAIRRGPLRPPELWPAAFEQEVTRLERTLAVGSAKPQAAQAAGAKPQAAQAALPRYLVRRLLLDTDGYVQRALLPDADGRVVRELQVGRERLAEAGCPAPAVETAARYDWAQRVLEGVLTEPGRYRLTATDRIDRWLTHRLWGTLVFALVMFLVFQAVFVGAQPAKWGIDWATGRLAGRLADTMPEGALRSLLAEGIVGGVGSVVAFLPQILILFFFIAVLEDCGYMARAAYLMDRLMSRVGLSGRSFIPMLSSFACAVPGIMAARVIANERDRLTTIAVMPLLTCSARLPIYALLIAAFIPGTSWLGGLVGLQGLTLAALYALGIVAAVAAALVLKRTILRGRTPPFLLELPSYKWPSARTACHRVTERGWIFLRDAGTLILAVAVLVWAAAYYPHDHRAVEPLLGQQEDLRVRLAGLGPQDPRRQEGMEEMARLQNQIAAAYQRNSYLGRLGRTIEPVVKPLGWDWRIGCCVLASLPAREIVVATLGVVYGVGQDAKGQPAEAAGRLQSRLRAARWEGTDRPVFTLPVALSLLVFYTLCMQCAATLAVMRRETNSWRWPIFVFSYMTALAYVAALGTYQVSNVLGTLRVP